MSSAQSSDLQATLEAELKQHQQSKDLIGIAGVVIRGNNIQALASEGLRKKGSPEKLTVDDKWHLGSVTKSMTATVIARLVEKGILSWDQNLDLIPGGENPRHSDWNKVTLKHLLHHSSGAPANFSLLLLFSDDPETDEALHKERLAAVQGVLNKPTDSQAGTAFQYSNVGYTIAAVLAEQATNKGWETLMREELFEPLALNSAGFGPPKDNSNGIDQPRGHKSIFGFKFAVQTSSDNPKVMGPAGNVHMSLSDLARYAQEHMKGARGESDYLDSAQYKALHTAELDSYAKGWVIKAHDPLADGQVIWHNGSNTMWYCLLTLLPTLDTAVAITVNEGNIQKAEASAVDITRALVKAMKHSSTHQVDDH
ncbi:serine hydrolase domain-containing protein [Pseudoteredinibacter isoporae]|uniref:CubicO group peptidase (Beta-lactamase class C family) n=1 Tax=Pseudoteredinibacter isoporae TaxID=570281 RepID=A0A7X0JSI4_9GAMM|nr:serine hydrolase domain-containing protein [Pseudoteredinibacter isoporae]MBB6520506.1 CubicO group peptidase (beta-lactamase class C family) [Pseudoteredinibacter isoporae]NHO86073.1 beta-lactamase family protein [Pseudoteredinibacter isoporae]NIB25476.1 beta-lactamase family protein [Pseudoteredinibacter isoporae]